MPEHVEQVYNMQIIYNKIIDKRDATWKNAVQPEFCGFVSLQ